MGDDCDILLEESLEGPKKRMKMDIDLEDALHEGVRDDRAASCGFLCRAVGTFSARHIDLMKRFLAAYNKSLQLTLTSTNSDIGLVLDGTAQAILLKKIWYP